MMNKINKTLMCFIAAMITVMAGISEGNATTYTYEVSNEKTWTTDAVFTSTTQYVSARTYIPGSRSLNYASVPVYSSKTTNTNSLGDRIEFVSNIYGPSYTRVYPFDGAMRTVDYGTYGATRLIDINDQRLTIGTTGSRSYVYDIVYDQFTTISIANAEQANAASINNLGQITGTAITDGGVTRKGFVYDCENGEQVIDVPTSGWTIPVKIDDEGNVYGSFNSPDMEETYFIARPDVQGDINCSLVARDDIAEEVVFEAGTTFEMSGDMARGIKIADFDGGGVNDLLINHEPGKTILYLGEAEFDDKIKYYGDEFNTLAEGIEFPTSFDINNDGLDDKVVTESGKTSVYYAKADGTYYYVPQVFGYPKLNFADFNNDGLLDFATVSGGFVTIMTQVATVTPVVDPVVDPDSVVDPIVDPDPVVDPVIDPVVDPEPVVEPTLSTPGIKNAEKTEGMGTIKRIVDNKLVLTDGSKLWYGDDTIVKFNNASSFEKGQNLEFKAWLKPNGVMVGIKIEVIDEN